MASIQAHVRTLLMTVTKLALGTACVLQLRSSHCWQQNWKAVCTTSSIYWLLHCDSLL